MHSCRRGKVNEACAPIFAGHFADLKALIRLRQKYGFLLVIDEAHATFVCGIRHGSLPEAHLTGCRQTVLRALTGSNEATDLRTGLPGAVGRQRRSK